MRKFFVLAATTGLIAGSVPAVASPMADSAPSAPASNSSSSSSSTSAKPAANRPCITRKEFRKIKKKMRHRRVTRIVGGKGRIVSSSGKTRIRKYRACKGSPYYAQVTFTRGRVVTKYGFFN